MHRNLEKDLILWKNDEFRKPLLLNGARQVGKTYLIEEMFSKEFTRFIKVDFRVDSDSRRFVKNCQNATEIIEYLSLRYQKVIDQDTLLFFDEAQECIQILTALKYFQQDHPEIPVIVTGSYVRLKLHQMEREDEHGKAVPDPEIDRNHQDGHNNFLFPVGKIDELTLSEMTFDEFLLAYQEPLYDYIRKAYDRKVPLSKEYHNLAMDAFFTYLSIGGMPEAVSVYLKTRSGLRSRKTLQGIYDNYLGDMGLYQISASTINRSRLLFENIYQELNKTNKNFKIADIEHGKRYRDYLSSMDWLIISRLIYPSYQLKESLSYPLMRKEDSLFRIYLTDMGLFALQARISLSDFSEESKRNTLAGIYFENAFAVEAASRGISLFYWEGKTTSEMEFILAKEGRLYPVDVKKNRGSLNSLVKFREHNHDEFAIKVSQNGYGYDRENRLLTLPFYYVPFFLEEFADPEKSILSNQ